jgi:hypothetical protein
VLPCTRCKDSSCKLYHYTPRTRFPTRDAYAWGDQVIHDLRLWGQGCPLLYVRELLPLAIAEVYRLLNERYRETHRIIPKPCPHCNGTGRDPEEVP